MRQEVGSLMLLDVSDIEYTQSVKVHNFLIYGAAQSILSTNGRNWIPLVVKQIGIDRYEAVANFFILAVAFEAHIEKIWCVIIDDSPASIDSARLLTQEAIPKINLTNATFDEIKLGLEYLKERAENPLKIDIKKASIAIDEADRKQWKTALTEAVNLKCGITKGKKLDILKEVFYITPSIIVEPDPIINPDPSKPTIAQLKKMTVPQLKALAKEKGIEGYSKMKKADLVKALS